MHSITINISNEKLVEKDGLEIVSKEDMDDLKLLRATRGEEAIPFEKYMKNETDTITLRKLLSLR
ncbi:MAG: hypothetical protein ACL93V_07910 [Candidatus Electrothrix sp. YB6]